MEMHRIIIFICLFTFISSLKLTGQTDATYNKETDQYEFKLYFTNPNPINENVMFSFSQGEDEDGNEENVVFCEINPIERRSLRILNIRKLDEEITANCFYEVIKDPDQQIIFDNPEIRGDGSEDLEIEGDFTVYFKKPNSNGSSIISTINISTIPNTKILSSNIKSTIPNTKILSSNIKSTVPNSKISSGITTITKTNPSSLLKLPLSSSIIISIKNPVKSEEIIPTIATTTPANNTHFNSTSSNQLIKHSSSGLSAGQICAILIPCLALLLGSLIATLLLTRCSSVPPPPMETIITPNYVDTSSLAKVNVVQEATVQSIQPNPVQPQITNINTPVVNRVFEHVTTQNAQIVPVQQVQMVPVQEVQAVPVQEITQVQVPMTHTRGVSSSIGFAGAPQ
jgi:hypothetical protein